MRSWLRKPMAMALVIALLCMVGGDSFAGEKPIASWSVDAGKRDRLDTPVSGDLTADLDKGLSKNLRLVELVEGKEPVAKAWQWDPTSSRRIWWILDGKTLAGSQRRFELRKGEPLSSRQVELVSTDKDLVIQIAGAKVLRYVTAHLAPPSDIDPKYGRSGYIHPVWSPMGSVVTDQLPPDHLHQHGVWVGFSKTEFEGRKPNFWELGEGKGRVKMTKLEKTFSGPVFAGFRSIHEHEDLTAPDGPKTALSEVWEARVWNVGGPGQNGYWLLDIESTLKSASNSSMKLVKNHYGNIAIRGSRDWYGDRCRFLTSEGQTRKDGNQTRVRWSEISGSDLKGHWAGVALFDHPNNYRYPQSIRIHPQMPFQSLTPTNQGDWIIEPGQSYTNRYRFYIHDGEINAEPNERVARDFAEPPLVQ